MTYTATRFENMAKYSHHRQCPKCGRWDPQDQHHAAVAPHTPEHIERTCSGCGFSWCEAPLS